MMEKTKDEVDKCITCGGDTPYTITTHINMRIYYIEGAGQLCEECFEEIHKKKP